MTTALTAEVHDIAQLYVECGFSIQETSDRCGLSPQEVHELINQPAAKTFINEVYLDTGYRNRGKIGALLDRIIESKIEEAEDSEMWSDMDLAELLKLAHKIRMDEAKLDSPNTQVNIANFGEGSNYSSLVEKLINGGKK